MDIITSCFNCKKSAVVPEMPTLTPEQISMIQSTWTIPAKNPIDSGEAILLAYFEKYPKNQDKFSSFRNVPLLSLKVRKYQCLSDKNIEGDKVILSIQRNNLNSQGTPGFRTHAGRVVTVLNDAVTCLDKDDYLTQLETMWTKIGESHNRRKISQQAFNVSGIIIFIL